MIRNLADLARHVGANDATAESIGKRLYKDTRCGISFTPTTSTTPPREAQFCVRFAKSIIGDRAVSWRRGRRGEWSDPRSMPQELSMFLQLDQPGRVVAEYDPWTIQHTSIVRRTVVRGILTLIVRITERRPGKPAISVTGYAEGVDAECCPIVLAFPFSARQFDAAVQQADDDGCDMFDNAHGTSTDEG